MRTNPAQTRDPMLDQLLPELDRIEPRTRVAVTGLPEAKFREVPPDGGWSVAQVFEHLCLSNLAYLDGPLAPAVEQARARGPAARPWRPSMLGGWLSSTLDAPGNRLPTVPRFRVGPAVRDAVVDVFLASIARARTLVLEAERFDLFVGLASPASPLIRLNLGDALRILVVHSHRHLAQAERTRRAVGM